MFNIYIYIRKIFIVQAKFISSCKMAARHWAPGTLSSQLESRSKHGFVFVFVCSKKQCGGWFFSSRQELLT